MVNIIKEELPIEESLKRKLELTSLLHSKLHN